MLLKNFKKKGGGEEGDEQGTSHVSAMRETTWLLSQAQAMVLGSSFANRPKDRRPPEVFFFFLSACRWWLFQNEKTKNKKRKEMDNGLATSRQAPLPFCALHRP